MTHLPTPLEDARTIASRTPRDADLLLVARGHRCVKGLLAERDALITELRDVQRLIGILLKRAGGSVTLTDAEIEEAANDTAITSYQSDQDFSLIVRRGS